MINPQQIQAVHVAKRQLALSDDDYRAILKEIAGVYSCKQLDNKSYEAVMADFEHRGFRHVGKAPDYWRNKKLHGGIFADAREVYLIERLAKKQRYSVPQMAEKFSKGRTMYPDKLTPKEARNLIEMLKAAAAREDAKEPTMQLPF